MVLRDYQKSGIAKITEFLKARGSAYLADEMGLGKSIQATQVAREIKARHILVVCPAGLRLNWEKEFNSWAPEYLTHCVLTGARHVFKSDAPCAVITSYDLAHLVTDNYWDLVIFDEAHYLKTATTKRAKVCFGPIWEGSKYKLLLSGTPCPNGVIDGYTQFNKLAPDIFPNRYKFGWRYTNATRNWFTGGWDFKGGKNLAELKELLQTNFMVRRTKKKVLSELPDKIYSIIPVSIRAASDYTISDGDAARIAEGRQGLQSEELATKRRGLGLLKVDAAVELINNIVLEKKRLVVFAYHKDVIKELAAKINARVLKMTGETSALDRQEFVDVFQSVAENSEPIVLIGQITAAGVGITLTAADICVFVELDWSPANMAQAIDRLHRIGQKESVQVQYLVAEGTMDTQIIKSLRSKIESINEVLKSQ